MDQAKTRAEGEALAMKRGRVRDALIFLIISTVLYFLHLTVLFFVSPLMIYSIGRKKSDGYALICIEALIVFAVEVVRNIKLISSPVVFSLNLAFALVIPLSLLAAGVIYLALDKLNRVGRVALSLIPAVLFTLAIVIALVIDRALLDQAYTFYQDEFAQSLSEVMSMLFGSTIDMNFLFRILVVSIACLILPFFVGAVCATVFVFETAVHSKEGDWEDSVKAFELKPDAVWCFIIPWALVLADNFISMPMYLSVIVLNFAFTATIVYAIQGFAVLYVYISRALTRLRSLTLFVILFALVLMIPGLNLFILVVLPVLGLLEAFFDMKKIGEKRNEDHS